MSYNDHGFFVVFAFMRPSVHKIQISETSEADWTDIGGDVALNSFFNRFFMLL